MENTNNPAPEMCPCPVGTKSEKGERSRNSYQLAPFQGWKGGEQ